MVSVRVIPWTASPARTLPIPDITTPKPSVKPGGGINTNMSKSEYGYLKNVYWLYDCAAAFTQELDETVSYEYTDDTYHTVTTKGGTYCAFCYGTNHTVSRKLERHSMVTEVLPSRQTDASLR